MNARKEKLGMNGLISELTSRHTKPSHPNILSTVILGTCLFGGFASGINVTPSALAAMNPFRTETIRFDKISWISNAGSEGLSVANIDHTNDSNPADNLAFTPFELRAEQMKRFHLRSFASNKTNFKKLNVAVQEMKLATHYDAFEDYQIASTRIRGEFSLALNETPLPVPAQMIAMTSSSANLSLPVSSAQVDHVNPRVISQAMLKQDLYSDPVVAAPHYTLPEKPIMAPQTLLSASEIKNSKVSLLAKAPANLASYDVATVNTQYVATQKNTLAKAASVNRSPAVVDDQPTVTTSTELTQAQQSKLTNELLAVQLSSEAKKPYYAYTKREPIAQANKAAPAFTDEQDETPSKIDEHTMLAQSKRANFEEPVKEPKNCDKLSTHSFVLAARATSDELANQVCAGEVSWISNPTSGSAWVKVSGTEHYPTITLNPAPNGGSTMLLDDNSLGLIAIKSGVHVTKGMGIILGRVPENYKITFIGRAEEPEQFESSGKKYFVILNAEPGAGVMEIESKATPNVSATVFTPVLEDTITYLDLAAPVTQDLKIKVVKNGTANDPEVSKLTVGLSTQATIQGITRADGQAVLKSVNLVPGFPVFVDVSSHTADAEGFTYRYELKHAQANGSYVVNEVSEKSIRHWLKQVKQGLSDQSAMVIGLYNRERLDGFKSLHTTQVNPLTAKFGLEPINYSIMWNGSISQVDPLEGDIPRFMSVQVPEGLSQVKLINEAKQMVTSDLIPVSPRIIHVISD